jgi:alkanesulfonate monooxygenase SsuD/methylene tetrahydromethanopterin reductase-like flavin-dependent oxidoreductase (luciferase family)
VKIQFGLRIPEFPVDSTRGPAFVDQVLNLMEAGKGSFTSAWVADHFVPWATFQDPSTDTYECLASIAFLAGMFPSYTLGSIVLSQSYRNPAYLAKVAATLQALSKGRLVLSIGAGWKKDEYLAYGYDYPDTPTRIHQLGEAAQIIKMMWHEPRATFHGKYYHIQDAICEPKPDPLPPLLIGGGGKKLTLRIVAQYADWWNFPGGSAENYGILLDTLRGHCQAVGRDYDSIVKTWCTDSVSVAETQDEALRIAQSSSFYDPETSIVGTPDQVAQQLKAFADLGVTVFMLRFADFPRTEMVTLFGKTVMPRFK